MEKKKTIKPPAREYKHNVQTCIQKITRLAKKSDPSIASVEFDLSLITTFRSSMTKYKTGQGIKIYRKTKTGNTKTQKSFIAHTYCPFCGKKF